MAVSYPFNLFGQRERALTSVIAALVITLLLAGSKADGQESRATFRALRASDVMYVSLVGAAVRYLTFLRLTPALPHSAGAGWFPKKQFIATRFRTTFEFRLTAQGGVGGADGFAFVLQNAGLQAVGGQGSAGGFAIGNGNGNPNNSGIPHSIAVFFDTYRNLDAGDPSSKFVKICANGGTTNMRWPPARLALNEHLRCNLKDGQVHRVHIRYIPPLMVVFFDSMNTPPNDCAG
jgi:hypothetical protein